MFKLFLKSDDGKISYKSLSVSLKYLVDEKKLERSLTNLEKLSELKISNLQKKNFLSKDNSEIRVSTKSGKPDEMLLKKVVMDKSFTIDYFRNHLAGTIQNLSKEELSELHIFIPEYEIFEKYFINEDYYLQTFVEGIQLGNYEFYKYKEKQSAPKKLNVYFHYPKKEKIKNVIRNAVNLFEGVKFTKDLQNEPGNYLYPDKLAELISKTLKPLGVKIKIFDEKELKKRNMGGLLAVGMGSENPPRMIILQYNGIKNKKKKPNKLTALVGKGVTFDTGGISIKPASQMGEMKADMSGAAVVAGVIYAAAKNKMPINLLGIIPTAENMPSGSSMRPGDIVITASGKSIEVDNTDAEGRMILADALDYASKQSPSEIIDLATLTGACVVALGEYTAGLFTKNDSLAKGLFNSGMQTFERVWRLPLWDEYNQLNKSDVADVKNVGGRWGGAISAAKFLENFVDEKIPWAHLDIAGPSMGNDLTNYSKKFMTGFGVRLLVDYLSSYNKK